MKKIVAFSCCVLSLSGMRVDSCGNKALLWDKYDLELRDIEAIHKLLVRGFLLSTSQQGQRQPSFERHPQSTLIMQQPSAPSPSSVPAITVQLIAHKKPCHRSGKRIRASKAAHMAKDQGQSGHSNNA